MNTTTTITVHARADGKPIYPYTDFGDNAEFESETLQTDYLSGLPAFDATESVYKVDSDETTTLLQYRVIRRGRSEICDICDGAMEVYCDGWNKCICENGVKQRDNNPEWNVCISGTEPKTEADYTGRWQKRYEAEFGEPPNRPRAKITDEINQDNANDYTWQERFEHENGRTATTEEIAEQEDLLQRIFGTECDAGGRKYGDVIGCDGGHEVVDGLRPQPTTEPEQENQR